MKEHTPALVSERGLGVIKPATTTYHGENEATEFLQSFPSFPLLVHLLFYQQYIPLQLLKMVVIRPFTITTLAALAPGALANLLINNWCPVGITLVQSHAAGCDSGVNGNCITDGDTPWVIPPGTGESILNLGYIADGVGTSVKISKDDIPEGVLQFEYNVVSGEYGGLYWDLSDLDGSGGGLVGTPFRSENVKVTPTGNGAGTESCVIIRCAADTVCLDSYQHPDDPNTKWCPVDTGDIWLDLCMPGDIFQQSVDGDQLKKSGSNKKNLIGDSVYSLHEPKKLRSFQA